MAEITITPLSGSGSRAATVTTLGASDTFSYQDGLILVINNLTAGAITPNLLGDAVTDVPVAGVGSVDTSGGYTAASIGAGESAAIPLDTVSKYLTGTVTVTAGDGAEVYLLAK